MVIPDNWIYSVRAFPVILVCLIISGIIGIICALSNYIDNRKMPKAIMWVVSGVSIVAVVLFVILFVIENYWVFAVLLVIPVWAIISGIIGIICALSNYIVNRKMSKAIMLVNGVSIVAAVIFVIFFLLGYN